MQIKFINFIVLIFIFQIALSQNKLLILDLKLGNKFINSKTTPNISYFIFFI